MSDEKRRQDVSDIVLEGFVGADPERRTSRGGTPWVTFGVARGYWKKPTGKDLNPGEELVNDWVQWTQWFDVTAFGDAALGAVEKIRKGSRVQVKGRLQTSNFADRESGQKRFSLNVIADEIVIIEYEKSTKVSNEPDDLPF